jgi:hypothetical protein
VWQAFLPSLDDLREQLLQLAREGQIADGHLFEHEAKTLCGGLTRAEIEGTNAHPEACRAHLPFEM